MYAESILKLLFSLLACLLDKGNSSLYSVEHAERENVLKIRFSVLIRSCMFHTDEIVFFFFFFSRI